MVETCSEVKVMEMEINRAEAAHDLPKWLSLALINTITIIIAHNIEGHLHHTASTMLMLMRETLLMAAHWPVKLPSPARHLAACPAFQARPGPCQQTMPILTTLPNSCRVQTHATLVSSIFTFLLHHHNVEHGIIDECMQLIRRPF